MYRITRSATILHANTSLTFAHDRSPLSFRPLRREHGRVALVLSPLLDPREHGGVPKHAGHDAEHDLVPADIQLLQGGRLAPNVRLDTVLSSYRATTAGAVALQLAAGSHDQ